MNEIYSRIKELLKKEQLTDKELGSMLGLKKSPLTNWKNGRSKPTIEQIIKISEIFNISIDELLKGVTIEKDLPEEEQDLLTNFRQADEKGKYLIRTVANLEANRNN